MRNKSSRILSEANLRNGNSEKVNVLATCTCKCACVRSCAIVRYACGCIWTHRRFYLYAKQSRRFPQDCSILFCTWLCKEVLSVMLPRTAAAYGDTLTTWIADVVHRMGLTTKVLQWKCRSRSPVLTAPNAAVSMWAGRDLSCHETTCRSLSSSPSFRPLCSVEKFQLGWP